ncbi:hypothetical protein CR513_38172, partial [Mucuna pruriens]
MQRPYIYVVWSGLDWVGRTVTFDSKKRVERGMSDPYERVKGGRLAFKGGILASRSKSIDKKGKKKKKNKDKNPNHEEEEEEETLVVVDMDNNAKQAEGEGSEYTIDAAKRMKYEQLFPVEAKKFGYQPKTNFNSLEDALDDRVKKKADRSGVAVDHFPTLKTFIKRVTS